MVEVENIRKGIDLIKFDNGLNLKAEFINYGAMMYSLKYDDDLIILKLKNIETALASSQFYGKTLGQVAGRILCKGQVNGRKYNLIETDKGTNFCLHGGKLDSLSFKKWKYSVKETNKEIKITFSIKTKDLMNGFFGPVNIKVIYRFSKLKNSFKIEFKAIPYEDTLINLSNHIYWHLDDDIDHQRLKFNSKRVGKNLPNLLIDGVMDTPECLDFSRSSMIKTKMDYIEKNCDFSTIDNTYLFEENKLGKVNLIGKKYSLTLKTNYPAMNIYVDNSMTPLEFDNFEGIPKKRGIALEPQLFVYNLENITFKKGDKYNFYEQYNIEKR